MMTTKMSWAGGLKFEGMSAFGHKLVTDGSKSAGGEEAGYKPTELLLFGIAGCTGIDVVRILQKQRQELTALDIELTGHQGEGYPKPFHTIEIKYIARGRNLDPRKVEQAIELSEDKYCVVSQTVKQETKVVRTLEVLPE
jgi:putative redox protein